MGTRADFYVGRGQTAEWLGSIAWDGYPDGIDDAVKAAVSEADFRTAVEAFFATRNDVSSPQDGWPWPWDTSHTTDYAYAFDGDRVHASCFGGAWFSPDDERPDDDSERPDFPNMADRKSVAWGKRSGVIVIGG